MTYDEYATPTPPVTTRRPFEELIIELAERPGRPCWIVTRCRPSIAARNQARGDRR